MPIVPNTTQQESMPQENTGIDMNLVNSIKAKRSGNTAIEAPTSDSIDMDLVNSIKAKRDTKTLPPVNNLLAASEGFNNAFGQFARGAIKLGLEGAAALGADDFAPRQLKNLEIIQKAADQKKAYLEQTNPVSQGIGNFIGQVGLSVPALVATGGAAGALSSIPKIGGMLGKVAGSGIGQGALSEAAIQGISNTDDNRLEAAAQGGAYGALGGAVGSVLGKVANKLINKGAGILSDKGQEIADVAATTGVTPSVLSTTKNKFARNILEGTGDLPGGSTGDTAEGLVGGVHKFVDNQLSKYKLASQENFGSDLLGVTEQAASKQGGNNYAAQKLLQEISSDDAWTKQVSDSGKLTHYYNQKAYNDAKSDFFAKAGMDHPIQIADLQGAVNKTLQSAINSETGQPLAAYSPNAIKTLRNLSNDLGVLGKDGKISSQQLDQQQTVLSGIISKMYKSNQVFGDADAQLVSGLKKDFDDVLESTLNKSSPLMADELRALKGPAFTKLQNMKQPLFATMIKDSTTPDEAAQHLFNAALEGKNTAKIFFDSLDPVGRNAVKYGYAQKFYDGIKTVGEQSPDDLQKQIAAMTNPKMRKMLHDNKDFIHTFFSPQEIKEMNGAVKAAHYLDNYASTFSNSPTGRIAANTGKVIALGATGMASLPAAAGVYGASITFNRIMNSKMGPFLQAASDIKPGTPAYASLMEKIAKSVAINAHPENESSTGAPPSA